MELSHCPSCQEPVSEDPICGTCGWDLTAGPGKSDVIVKAASRPKIPATVLVGIAIDGTGSSARFAEGIPKVVKQILEGIEAKAAEVEVYVQVHRDEEFGQMPVLITSGAPVQKALADIRSIKFTGGGDAKETHADGVQKLLDTVPWIRDPRSGHDVMLLITTDETKPLRDGTSIQELGSRIAAEDILFYHIGEPRPVLEDLTSSADGLFIEISNTPDEAECRKVAAACAASIVATVGSGSTKPMPA